ncbi:hypothetical protein SAMN05428642_102338 [Flaviramulus basaltis]|uniref:YD repeat-containing protein n=1 Tax=Flaviramulus basaltis TaxID=369401 RepID=A0A1K2IHD6_9FLAO|nr:hypothetical protein [Flaviramulus basaltis]SFZ91799.1 hypothetical protein SAMN05428642_102338 [Flaviramulus basaltis]
MNKLIMILTVFTLALYSCSNENEINSQYDNQQKFIKITEITTQETNVIAEGYIEYSYGENGYISQLIASSGYTKNYTYNSNNQIIKITFQDNSDSYFIDYRL